MRALGVIVAIEVAVLALVVGLVLRGGQPTTFPTTIAGSPVQVSPSASASVPVSISLGPSVMTGATTTVTLRRARGGHAVVVSAGP
jgi:hypothetical protein